MHDPTITQSGIARMHRVRVGLIGLAWVFLLVMLAIAILAPAPASWALSSLK